MPIEVTVQKATDEQRDVVSAKVHVRQTNDRDYNVWYRITNGPHADGADALLAATLLPAMKIGGPLQISGQISARLLQALPTIQDIFHNWCPDLQKVVVESERKTPSSSHNDRPVASFFSGGVDSFYTLLKHQDEITHLIFLHGFDIFIDNTPLRQTVSKTLRNVAAELQKPLIEVETNIRSLVDPYVSWTFCNGPCLASVALLLAPQFKRIYIPSSHSYSQLFPWGSHPIVDPLWSTEELEIAHDGCESSRVEKVLRVMSCDIALKTLRVCWENRHGAYNCGECEKCLRTMVSLRIAGSLERCSTFNRSLDLGAVARLYLPDENSRRFIEENLDALTGGNNDPQLARALRDCLEGRHYRGKRKRAHDVFDTVLDTVYPRRMRSMSRRALMRLRLIKNGFWTTPLPTREKLE